MNAITPNKGRDRDDRRGGGGYNKYQDNKQNKNRDQGEWITPNKGRGPAPIEAPSLSNWKGISNSDSSSQRLGPTTFGYQAFINNTNKFAGLTDDDSHQDSSSSGKDSGINRPMDMYSNMAKYGSGNKNMNNPRHVQRQNSRENSRNRVDMNGPSKSYQAPARQNSIKNRDNNNAGTNLGHSQSQIVARRSQQAAAEQHVQQHHQQPQEPAVKFSETDEPEENELERYRGLLKTIIQECIQGETPDGFTSEIKEKVKRQYRWVCVREMLMFGLEHDDKWRTTITDIISALLNKKDSSLFTVAEFKLAVKCYLDLYADAAVDIPQIASYTSKYFNTMLHHNYLSFKDIHEYSKMMIEDGHGGKYLAEQLKMLQEAYGPLRVRELWKSSNLKFSSFLNSPADEAKFIESNVS